jgi:hypothetical protein
MEESDEVIVPQSGMTCVGVWLDKTQIGERLNQTRLPGVGKPNLSNRAGADSDIGRLGQAKPAFDPSEALRDDEGFTIALQVDHVPSSPTLRQRVAMVAGTSGGESILRAESARRRRALDGTGRAGRASHCPPAGYRRQSLGSFRHEEGRRGPYQLGARRICPPLC